MSPFDKEIIRRKLAVIIENINALVPVMSMTKEEYIADIYKRKATERMLQELIEAAIDINIHIIVQSGNRAPEDYHKSFIDAGKAKVISLALAEQLAPSAGLRNRLVHEYDLIDHVMVLDAVRDAQKLYPEYIRQIEGYIS